MLDGKSYAAASLPKPILLPQLSHVSLTKSSPKSLSNSKDDVNVSINKTASLNLAPNPSTSRRFIGTFVGNGANEDWLSGSIVGSLKDVKLVCTLQQRLLKLGLPIVHAAVVGGSMILLTFATLSKKKRALSGAFESLY